MSTAKQHTEKKGNLMPTVPLSGKVVPGTKTSAPGYEVMTPGAPQDMSPTPPTVPAIPDSPHRRRSS